MTSERWPPPLQDVRRRAADRIYVARREWPAVYVASPDDVERIAVRGRALPDWGTEQGARALAGALVLDLCHIAAPESVTSAVANELVRGLPAQGFQIDADELLPWLYGTVRRPERRAGRRRLRPRCRRTPARNARPSA
jgi:hypothetical protein